MRNLFKGKLITVFVIVAAMILAGVSVFAAVKLFQTGGIFGTPDTAENQGVTAQTEVVAAKSLTFTIQVQEIHLTPTTVQASIPISTFTPTATSTPIPTQTLLSTPTSIADISPTPISITLTPTRKAVGQLPDAGTAFPTLLGITFGCVLVFFSLLIAI